MSKKAWKKLQKTVSTNSCKTTKMETRSARAAKKQLKQLKKLEKWKFQDLASFLVPKDEETVSIQTETDVDIDEASSTVFAAEDNNNRDSITRANNVKELSSPRSLECSTSASVSPKSTSVREKYRNRQGSSASAKKDRTSSGSETDTQQVATTDIDLFFNCIAATVKKFRPYNQVIAKTTVFSLISQIEMVEISGASQVLPSASVPCPSQLPNNTLAFAPTPSPFPQSTRTPVPPPSEIQPSAQ